MMWYLFCFGISCRLLPRRSSPNPRCLASSSCPPRRTSALHASRLTLFERSKIRPRIFRTRFSFSTILAITAKNIGITMCFYYTFWGLSPRNIRSQELGPERRYLGGMVRPKAASRSEVWEGKRTREPHSHSVQKVLVANTRCRHRRGRGLQRRR